MKCAWRRWMVGQCPKDQWLRIVVDEVGALNQGNYLRYFERMGIDGEQFNLRVVEQGIIIAEHLTMYEVRYPTESGNFEANLGFRIACLLKHRALLIGSNMQALFKVQHSLPKLVTNIVILSFYHPTKNLGSSFLVSGFLPGRMAMRFLVTPWRVYF